MAHDHHSGHEEKRLSAGAASIGFLATAVICLVVGILIGVHPSVRAVDKGAENTSVRALGGFDSTILPVADSPIWGNPSAPVTVTVFSNFGCVACQNSNKVNGALERVRREYSPDQVRVVFKHSPFKTPEVELMHRASVAAHRQGRFWEYHDAIFNTIDLNRGGQKRSMNQQELIQLAKKLQLNVVRFKRDFYDARSAWEMAKDDALIRRLEKARKSNDWSSKPLLVDGTPTYFINGRIAESNSFAAIGAAIDAELKNYRTVSSRVGAGNCYYVYAVNENTRDLTINSLKTDPKIESFPALEDANGAGGDPAKGTPNAPVTIIEYSDFQCPFCSRVNPTIANLLEAYPGKIQVVFKHLPLSFHADAHLAAQASLAAHAQGKFWEYHDTLFENQKALKRPDLERYAQDLGLDMAQFKADLDSGKHKATVDAQMAEANAAGINGTPGFLVGDEKLSGAQPFEKFKEAIDRQLAGK